MVNVAIIKVKSKISISGRRMYKAHFARRTHKRGVWVTSISEALGELILHQSYRLMSLDSLRIEVYTVNGELDFYYDQDGGPWSPE